MKRIYISPLRYPGGKGVLYPRLKKLIRTLQIQECTYVEPYAGGVGAGLALLVTEEVKNIVINDFDPAIYSFWRLLKEDSDFLINKIRNTEVNLDEWHKQRDILFSGTNDLHKLGFATFYLNRTNRSGILKAGPIGGLKQNGNYKIDARFNKDKLIERIRIISLYSDNIKVSSKDGIDIIKDYAQSPKAFIYADPPYFEKAQGLYLNSFFMKDHESLAITLNQNADSNWVLTYDNFPAVKELYRDRKIYDFELNYSVQKKMRARETVVTSDKLPPLGEGWAL